MALHVFGNKFKPRQPAPTPGNDPQAAQALAAAQRDVQIAQAKAAQATRDADDLRRKAQEADAERERSTIRNAVTNAAAKAKALNPDHVVALRAADFIIHSGKVVSKADPTKDVDASLAEWFGGEGKYLLAPTVPGGGSGAPATQVVRQGPAPDLKTDEGLTAFTRQLTHGMFKPLPGTAPAAQGIPAGAKPPGT